MESIKSFLGNPYYLMTAVLAIAAFGFAATAVISLIQERKQKKEETQEEPLEKKLGVDTKKLKNVLNVPDLKRKKNIPVIEEEKTENAPEELPNDKEEVPVSNIDTGQKSSKTVSNIDTDTENPKAVSNVDTSTEKPQAVSNVDTDMETTKQVSNIDTDTEGMILKADPVDTADRNHICFFAVFFIGSWSVLMFLTAIRKKSKKDIGLSARRKDTSWMKIH